MKNRYVLLFLLFLLNFNSITFIFADNMKFKRVLNTYVYNKSIAQDKDGILLIGTEGKGLLFYNGEDLKKISIVNSTTSLQIVSSILVDREGLIWFFMQGQGLCCYNKETGSCKNYKPEEINPNIATSSKFAWLPNIITEDKEGLIWVGTADGLNCYDKKRGQFTQYKHNPGNSNSLSNDSVWVVYADKEGFVWIGTEDGLNCYDKNTNKFHCYKHDQNNHKSISDSCIKAITEDKEGNLWIGTKNTGIDKFDRKSGIFTNYKHHPDNKNGLSYNEIRHLMVDRYNNLWICNEGNVGLDLYNIKTGIFAHYNYNPDDPNCISSDQVLYAFEDNAGIVWLIDGSNVLNKCIPAKSIFKNYTHNPQNKSSISSNILAKLYEDKNGNIWIGTCRGGICLYVKDDKFENLVHSCSLPGISVHSILDASDNKLWLGIRGGFLCLFDTNTKQIIKTLKNPDLKLTPAYLTRDDKNPNILWFAYSYAEGLVKFNTATNEFTIYKHDSKDNSSVSGEITLGIFQHNNTLWIATGGDGLCKFDKATGKCKYYKHDKNDKTSISGNIVVELFTDSKGNFWVTTDDGGLNKFNKQTEKFTHYGIDCGFPSNSTRHILEDHDGYFWISTNSGTVKFDPKASKVVKRFTTADGLESNQFDMTTSPLKDSKGNFWFSTSKGICKFRPEEASKIQSNLNIPVVVLSSFKSKDGTYNEDVFKKLENITLSWPENSFWFTFAALDYMHPEKNQYAYMLEGFDSNWNYIGTNRFGQYSNLSPGKYTLHLKGSNNDGIWNEEGTSIKITITPPFWMTLWFKGAAEIAGLCIIVGAFQLRIRALKKKAIYVRNNVIAEVTAQVAHDIRSPLAALNTALKDLRELPEQKRILIRNATRRISDIANNLLIKYRIKGKGDDTATGEQKNIKAELVSSLLEYLISEKRVQMTEKSIGLALELGNNTHSCFVNLEPEKFKRVISNLINNASEAIETTEGLVRIILTKKDDDLVIKIIDTGNGIPEYILHKIKRGEITSNKKGGCGLGISSAIQNVKSWNGNYNIQSKIGEGTTFTITLPIVEEPDWFQSNIVLSPTTHIIVLDDDESIHNIWQTHFYDHITNKPITLDHFYEPLAFTEYCKTSRSEQDLFLVDYELINPKETGLDLIEQLNLKEQAILVTSRYEEQEVRERIKNLGIKIIPKNFAPYIPVFIDDGTIKKEQPELILIDDDRTLTKTWEVRAILVKKKMATFNRSDDFKNVMGRYNKDIPIFIDSDLKEKVPGEFFAKFLYEQGFRNLYLATGYGKDMFDDMPWIKEIVGKEPPF